MESDNIPSSAPVAAPPVAPTASGKRKRFQPEVGVQTPPAEAKEAASESDTGVVPPQTPGKTPAGVRVITKGDVPITSLSDIPEIAVSDPHSVLDMATIKAAPPAPYHGEAPHVHSTWKDHNGTVNVVIFSKTRFPVDSGAVRQMANDFANQIQMRRAKVEQNGATFPILDPNLPANLPVEKRAIGYSTQFKIIAMPF